MTKYLLFLLTTTYVIALDFLTILLFKVKYYYFDLKMRVAQYMILRKIEQIIIYILYLNL